MIDNQDLNKILEKLENLEDEELAVELLRDFNNASKKLGKLLLNLDQSLTHEQWKKECDLAKLDLEAIVKKIDEQR